MVINEYNLSSVISDLNGFIKDSSKKYENRRDASFKLAKLYSSEDSLEHRKNIYELCSAFSGEVNSFTKIDKISDEIWAESDKFILQQIPNWIVNNNCTTLSKIGTDFLKRSSEPINDLVIIDWLNKYFKSCSNIQCVSHLVNYAIFPNQKGFLKKIGELWYDNNIPEEFKDLSETAETNIQWRKCLLDTRIEGYSMHSPKSISDIYHSISDTFEKSENKLLIAKHAIAIDYKGNTDTSYVYARLKDIYNDVPESKTVTNAEGFDWEKFIAYAIVGIIGEVASKVNIQALSNCLSTETKTYDKTSSITWVDTLLNFAINYRGGRYKTKVTELDNHGIWINQNGDFCMFSTLYKDGGISDDLKDLTNSSPIVNYNYRDILLHNDSKMSYVIDKDKVITQNDVLNKIDESIENYQADKQNPEFRSLIFRIMELDKLLHISDHMKYYKANKEKLIVGSLGEGDTMNMVAGIIQQGDEKIKIVQDILQSNSLEELQNINKILHGCPIDQFEKVSDIVERLMNEPVILDNDYPISCEDPTDFVKVPKIHELEVVDFEGNNLVVKADQIQYAGLSLDEIQHYVAEAKGAVVKYFRELNEEKNLGLQFDTERIAMHSYSQLYGISDRYGNELPIVVHSYKGPQYRYFDLNWYDWQMLSRKNSMLFVLTVTGLQCIPLYALPVRNINISIDNEISDERRAALLTLASVAKQYTQLSFDFGNNMPQGFKDPLPFDFVPDNINQCITSIKQVCDKNIPQIAGCYNSGKNVTLVRSTIAYSEVMKEIEEGNARDIFEAPINDIQAPSVGTKFIE